MNKVIDVEPEDFLRLFARIDKVLEDMAIHELPRGQYDITESNKRLESKLKQTESSNLSEVQKVKIMLQEGYEDYSRYLSKQNAERRGLAVELLANFLIRELNIPQDDVEIIKHPFHLLKERLLLEPLLENFGLSSSWQYKGLHISSENLFEGLSKSHLPRLSLLYSDSVDIITTTIVDQHRHVQYWEKMLPHVFSKIDAEYTYSGDRELIKEQLKEYVDEEGKVLESRIMQGKTWIVDRMVDTKNIYFSLVKEHKNLRVYLDSILKQP